MSDEVLFIAKPSFLRNHSDALVAAGVGLLMAFTGMAILIDSVTAIGGILFFINTIAALVRWFQYLTTTLTVTHSRSVFRKGVFESSITEVRHQDVRSTTITQSVFQRMFGVSTLHIASAGHAGVEISVAGIRHAE